MKGPGALRKPKGGGPDVVTVACGSTKGTFEIEIHQSWAPNGAARFLDLVENKFFDNQALYRVVPNFLLQFGHPPDASKMEKWKAIPDDIDIDITFEDGYLSFAGSGANSRTHHVFFTLGTVKSLGKSPWETPFGFIKKSSLRVLHSFNAEYGDLAGFQKNGQGVDQGKLKTLGYTYLKKNFPKLDYLKECKILVPGGKRIFETTFGEILVYENRLEQNMPTSLPGHAFAIVVLYLCLTCFCRIIGLCRQRCKSAIVQKDR
jgi:peptidyl-prolyl cis-trans isomerase A (cyclophilin A)